MSNAEYFLMGWAILSTVFAGWCWGRAKFYFLQHRRTAVMLAELAFGEIEAKLRPDGFMVVENDEMKMTFKKQEEK